MQPNGIPPAGVTVGALPAFIRSEGRHAMYRLALLITLLCALAAGAACSGKEPAPAEPPAVLARSASIVVKVPDYQAARDRVVTLTRRFGGHLRQARTEVNLLGQKHGSLTLQLAATDLDRFVDELRKVGKLYSEHVQTTDRTSLYSRLEDRIRLLKGDGNASRARKLFYQVNEGRIIYGLLICILL